MTRRDYRTLARAVKRARREHKDMPGYVAAIVATMVEEIAKDNANFDAQRFYKELE